MHDLPIIVILTALSEEYLAVREHLYQVSDEEHNDTIYERGIFNLNGKDIAQVIIRECGQRNVIAAMETERAIQIFLPDALFFVGIAGSRKPSDFKVGDVIIADKIYSYEGGKYGKYAFQARPDTAPSSFSVVEKAKAIRLKEDWKELIKTECDKANLKAGTGIIASGENLIEHYESSIGKILTKHYNDTQAVEMEGFGFSKAASRQGRETSHCLFGVVRGISDIIDNGKVKVSEDRRPDQAKELASSTASAFTFFLIFKLFENKEGLSRLTRGTTNSISNHPVQEPDNKFVTLPAPIANLPNIVGREKEIENLKDKLLKQNNPIAITGIRGIGKTSIVRSAVNQLMNSFEHIGWISLQGDDMNFDELFSSETVK